MKTINPINGYLARFPVAAAICYLAVIVGFLLTTWFYMSDFLERRQAVAETSDILSQLDGRKSPANGSETAILSGSPVLEGSTVTVAGATLLQRVAGAVARLGGNIVSSQVDLQGAQSKNGFGKVSINC